MEYVDEVQNGRVKTSPRFVGQLLIFIVIVIPSFVQPLKIVVQNQAICTFKQVANVLLVSLAVVL